MEEKIYQVLKKHRLHLKKREELMADLLPLFYVSNALPIGTKVVYNGREMRITNNREEFEGEPAYRCDYLHDELFKRSDFESIDLVGNDC